MCFVFPDNSLPCLPLIYGSGHFSVSGILLLEAILPSYVCSSSNSVFIRYCPLGRDGQIHPIPSAIARTLCLHFNQFMAFSFKPVLRNLMVWGLTQLPRIPRMPTPTPLITPTP